MKKIFILLSLITLSVGVFASTPKEQKDIEKREKKKIEKQMEAAKDSALYLLAEDGINQMKFVLQAENLSFKGRNIPYVQPSKNFILVQKDKVTIQTAFDNGMPGPNGLGGVTVDGYVSGTKCKKDKKGNIQLNFSVSGSFISAQVFITVMKGSNRATATINPNLNSFNLTMYGTLLPYETED